MSNHTEVGRNIVYIRTKLGITQEELALIANISVSRLRDIEHDAANYTIETLHHISSALGVPPWVLFVAHLSDEAVLEELHTIRNHLGLVPAGVSM